MTETIASRSFASEHFELERLADGVFGAIAVPGGAAFSNAGIIDLGDRTLIFDTFETPAAAADLRAAADELTGRPATYVINSHAHSDHWCGNQVFYGQTTIIATEGTREMMPAWGEYLTHLKEDPSELEQVIQDYHERLESETDPRWRATLEASIPRLRHSLASLPTLELCLPDQTFQGKLIFHGMCRTAELHAHGKGHTHSDATLVLPEDGIMFMGDLGFFRSQPFIVYGDPEVWKALLMDMERSNVATFVPGHGPVGTKADITLQWEYLNALDRVVRDVIRAGGKVEEALERDLPSPFDAWLMGSMSRFEANVRSLYERLSEPNAVA